MKGKKQGHKVISSCYRRKLSRTLSNSSISQLVQLGSYKKRITDLTRNNKLLATALQESRLESAAQNNILQDYAKDSNKILFARLKLNEMAKTVAKFVTDLEEVRSYLNIEIIDLTKSCGLKKRSSADKIYKKPNVDCIDEITEESYNSEIIAKENFPDTENCPDQSHEKQSHAIPSTSAKNGGILGDDNVIAPIMFAEDNSDKKKKSSNKGKSSKMSYDPDAGSLTPVLNIDMSSVKLKRNSSRRQSQFIFPGSRSTSKGKNVSSGKENSPEEIATPTIPVLPPTNNQIQNITEVKAANEEVLQNPVNENINKKDSKNLLLENHPKLISQTNQCDLPQVSITDHSKNFKPVVPPHSQFGESNHTVILCEDMELTDVVPAVQQIILSSPFAARSNLDTSNINRNITKESKENNAIDITVKTKDNYIDSKIVSEKDPFEIHGIHQNISKMPNQDDVHLSEINDDDEVQNVAMITFCEQKKKDEDKTSRVTKSSLIRPSRAKPVKYAVFFSSDDSEEESPFRFGEKTSKRNTVINTEIGKSCENSDSQYKVSTGKENKVAKSDVLKAKVDTGKKEKKLKEPKSNKKSEIKEPKSNKKSEIKEPKNNKKSEIKDPKSNKKSEIKDPKSNEKSENFSTISKNEICNKNNKIFVFSPISPDIKLKKTLTTSVDKNSKQTKEDIYKKLFSPTSPGSILKKPRPIIYSTDEEEDNEMPINKILCNNNLENSFENVIASPKSESRKVSFANTDTVCNFGKMSVSMKIAENKKVRRTSKSALDFKEPLVDKTKTKPSHKGAVNSSESTNIQKLDDPVTLNFSGDTEVYPLKLPSHVNSSSPTTDDLLFCKSTAASSTVSQKNVNKSHKHSKKIPSASKHISTKKLSLKKSKHSKNNVPQHVFSEKSKDLDVSLHKSPVSVGKPVKRKSLFNEALNGDSKENINFDHQVLEKLKTVSQEKVKNNSNAPAEIDSVKKTAGTSQKKASMKKLYDRPKLDEAPPELKKKKRTTEVKSLENSPVLRDTVNLPEKESLGVASKRRVKPVSYKEPTLNKKMRRE